MRSASQKYTQKSLATHFIVRKWNKSCVNKRRANLQWNESSSAVSETPHHMSLLQQPSHQEKLTVSAVKREVWVDLHCWWLITYIKHWCYKVWGPYNSFYVFERLSCSWRLLYLIKNTVKSVICEILYNKKLVFYWIYFKMQFILWCKAEFSASLLMSHDPSEIILTFLIILIIIYYFLNYCFLWMDGMKEYHIFKLENFCNIINVFVTFDQFNASLLNKSIFLSFWPQTFKGSCI